MFVHEASIPAAKLHLQPRTLVFKQESRSTILRLWSHLALGLWESWFIYLDWNFREEYRNASLSFPEEPSSVVHSGQSVLHQSNRFLSLVSIPLPGSWQYPSHPGCFHHFSRCWDEMPSRSSLEKGGLFWLTVQGCTVHRGGSHGSRSVATAHNVHAIGKQRNECWCPAQLLLIQPKTPAYKVVLPTLRLHFSTSTNPI